MRSSSFSVGWTFYYWSTYEDMVEFDQNDQFNFHDHQGEEVKNLYIKPIYNGFKEEILEYIYFDMNNYKSLITKVNEYLDTKMVKQSKAADTTTDEVELKYDISAGSVLHFSHLESICLYCDHIAFVA